MSIDMQKLQRLLDKEEIRETALNYSRGVDRHDGEIIARAYHPDATDDHGTFIGSVKDFTEHFNAVHAQNWDVHHHYTMNQTIDLDGDMAHVETYFLVMLRRRDSGPIDCVGGRYLDRFERRESRWAIADRVCLFEWNGEMKRGEFAVDPTMFLRGTWDRSDPSYTRPLKITRPHRVVS